MMTSKSIFPIYLYTLKTQSNFLILLLYCSYMSTEDLLYIHMFITDFLLFQKATPLSFIFFFYKGSVKFFSPDLLTVSFPDLLDL